MTVNERWNKTIRMEPTDRLIFWPKLSPANMERWREKYHFETLDDFFDYVHGDRLHGVSQSVKGSSRKCTVTSHVKGKNRHTEITTPLGNLTQTHAYDTASASSHPVEFPIKGREDLKKLSYYLNDMEFIPDEKALTGAERLFEGDIFAWECVGESPLMDFVEYKAGVADAHLMLFDYMDEVEELFAHWHENLKRKTELTCDHSRADMLFFVENTSTTLISPDQYRAYCFNHIGDYSRIIQSKGRIPALHMCGHLKALLPQLNEVGPRVFEAFTSPPVGNVSLPMGRKELPHVCFIGGTNAALWMGSAESIIYQIKKDLEELPHHRGIVISSGGVMPPDADPDKIRRVADWVREYPARF